MKFKHLFWILFGLNLLNYIDRQVLYAVFPLLQADLQLTDWQLGTLASAFMCVYMCYAPVMGYLADRLNRPRLIAISAVIWSGATLACAGAKNYLSLLVPRAVIGIGEGGFTTIAQPFLAEHVPAKKHALLLATFGLALPIGSALGYLLGGLIGQHWGWRMAFLITGIPGVFLGILAWTYLKDRARRPQTRMAPQLADYRVLLTNKPFLRICFAQAMSTFVMGGLSAWMPMYLHRYLAFNVSQAGLWFGGLAVICGAAGTWLGGKLAARSPRMYCQLTAYAFLAALPFCWAALFFQHAGAVLINLAVALTLLFIPTGAIAAALIENTHPAMRSMAFAVNIFIIHLLGDALSPALVGWLSDQWSLKTAVWIASLVLLPGAVAIGRIKSTISPA